MWDYTFIVWFVTDSCFSHSVPSMIGQVLFILYSIKKCFDLRYLKTSKIFLFYLLFCFFCWFNIHSGHALSVSTAEFMLNVVLRNFLTLFFLFQYLSRLNTIKVKKLLLVSFVIASIVLLIENYHITGSIIIRGGKSGINGNEQAVNNAIILGWILFEWNYRKEKNYILIGILLFFIILAGTRKAILSIVLIGTIGFILENPNKILGNSIKISFGVVFIFFVLFYVPFIYDIIGHRFESLFSIFDDTNTTELDSSAETRQHFIDIGLTYILHNPWNGYGIDCFREIPGSFNTYSHNNYVELLFGVGIPGMISFYLMYLYTLLISIKKYFIDRSKSLILGISILVTCLFADYAMVSYFYREMFLRMLLCYFFVAEIFSKNDKGLEYDS
ncbi:MAG: O-antigen ligase family protein [Paludibacteraceae bacterium]|nr:O-antigen ligase family protein [Paludibacteraceae bacterium]